MKKKILLLIVVSFISITVSAQAPFTIWEPAYTPRSRSVPSIPIHFQTLWKKRKDIMQLLQEHDKLSQMKPFLPQLSSIILKRCSR